MSAFSPLQLKNAIFTDVRITAQENADLEAFFTTNCEFGIIPISEDKRTWQIALRVNVTKTDKTPPYIGTVQCVGFFEVSPDYPADSVEKLAYINGTGMLYSIIREMICNITSRGPYPILIIATQSFVDSFEKRNTGTTKTKDVVMSGTATS